MKVLVFNQQKDLSLSAISAKAVVKEVLASEKVETDEVAVYFVTAPEICRLHAEFFLDPTPTDCISFPIDGIQLQHGAYHVLGEIFICPHSALDYLMAQSEDLNDDVYTETTLYLVHGLLHLIGYDDIEENDRLKMRTAEQKHMAHLLSKDLLLKSTTLTRRR